LVVNHDRTGLQRLQAFHNLIRDVGADNGDGYDRVDVFLLCREAELDSSWEMTFMMVKGPAHLWLSFFMGQSEE